MNEEVCLDYYQTKKKISEIADKISKSINDNIIYEVKDIMVDFNKLYQYRKDISKDIGYQKRSDCILDNYEDCNSDV